MFGQRNIQGNGGSPPFLQELVDGVLPEASGYVDPTDSYNLNLNLAAHSSLFMTSSQDENDYLRSSFVNPNDVLRPPMEDPSKDLKNVTLDDIDAPLHPFEGPLDMRSYLCESADFDVGEERSLFSNSSCFAADSSFAGDGQNSLYEKSQNVDNLDSDLGLNSAVGGYENHLHSAYLHPQYVYHSRLTTDSSVYSYEDQRDEKEHLTAVSHHSFSEQTEPDPIYSHNPRDSLNHSYPLLESSTSKSTESTLLLPSEDASFPSASKKGYRHRHARVYNLPKEEKKKRNQSLNNEASQLYRERKSRKVKDVKENLTIEEERNVELRNQHQTLFNEVAFYRDFFKSRNILQINKSH